MSTDAPARDARKAAKLAAKSSAAATITVQSTPLAESSTAAQNTSSPRPASSLKRRRGSNDQGEHKDDDGDDGNLLEIDIHAPGPLSKAEARAAKKRAKKGLPEPALKSKSSTNKVSSTLSDDGNGDDEEKNTKTKTGPPRQNSIWIGNLAFKTTSESLQGFLEKGITGLGGSSEGCITRVKLPKGNTGKGEFAGNKGFAYVDFATPELQDLAVGLSESFFEGRKLLIKKGNDHTVKADARTPRPEKPKSDAQGILKRQQHPESTTLFVGNLPFDATEIGLRDFVEANAACDQISPEKKEEEKDDEAEDDVEREEKDGGTDPQKGLRGGQKSGLRKVRLGAFEDTGRCKGFAFLDFLSPQAATVCLVNRKNYLFDGRRLNIQYASEEATKRSGGGRPKLDGIQNKRPKPFVKSATRRNAALNAPAGEAGQTEGEGEDGGDTGDAGDSTSLTHDRPARVDRTPRPKGKDERGKKWQATGRPRPGAALAMAKREKVGIVKAEGAKIVFD